MSLQMVGVSLTGTFHQGELNVHNMRENARSVERLGFDAIWSGDHIIMHNPVLDTMTVLATYAAVTERVKIGTSVYLMPLRHPVITAKQVTTLDLLSEGRFIFGIGVGGEIPQEFNAVDAHVSQRGRRADEGLEILQRVLSQDHVNYDGRYYQLRDVTLAPRPQQQPHPPIWVGGRSNAAHRRAARYGNGWVGYLNSSKRLEEAINHIYDLAPTYGRDPGTIQAGMLLFTVMAQDYETAKQIAVENLSRRYNQPFENIVDRYCVFGTSDQCLERLQRYIDAGMSNLIFAFACPADQMSEQIEMCAEDILPQLRPKTA
jgi:probable F420-dependent oxidoreductase